MSLTDAEIGRAIVALQSLKNGGYGVYYRRVRRFPDEQIRELLKITPETMKKCLAAYGKKKPRSWTTAQVAEGILRFAIKHGRWPTRNDMKIEKNRLPNKDALHRSFHATVGNSWSGQPRRSSMDVCIDWLMSRPAYWKQFTPQMILSIPNVTVRQQAMERYGIQKLLKDMGAKAFHEDEFGKLWRLPTDNPIDAHAQWVEVINATPESNGKKLHFFLRVPPQFNTAKEAVHWTFPDLERMDIPAEEFEIAQAS